MTLNFCFKIKLVLDSMFFVIYQVHIARYKGTKSCLGNNNIFDSSSLLVTIFYTKFEISISVIIILVYFMFNPSSFFFQLL